VFDDRLRYQGAGRLSLPALGDPRVFGLAVLGLVALVLVVAVVATGISHIDLSHGFGLMAFGAGPLAVDLREQALARFQAAAALENEDGSIAAEKLDEYNATVAEAMELDKQAAKAGTAEGNHTTVAERLSYYQERATGSPMRFNRTSADPRSAMTLGEQFVASDTYKQLQESGALQSPRAAFRTDPVTLISPRGGVQRFGAAATDVLHTEGNTPTLGAPAPVRLPDVYGYGRPPLTVRSLFPNEGIDADTIEYVAQVSQDKASGSLAVKQSTTATDAAGLKKQSSFGTEVKSAYAETIATWFATTRTALSQAQALRSFIDNQGRLFLSIEEEAQLINGNGTRPNLSGLLDQDSRLALDIHQIGGMDNLDALRRAKRLIRSGLSRLPADWVILNPADSEGYDLLKNDINDYRGGNPIGGGFPEGELPIWRLRRAESEEVAEGTAIVGSGVAATVFERQAPTVLTADQHSDFFVRNLVVILFEERIAFPIYFPTALCEVSLEDFQVGS
jgi:hypothetical protein